MSHSNHDNRKPKPVRNPKQPKIQKNKSNYENEMDLWNLEEDTSDSKPRVTLIEEPIEDTTTKASTNTTKLKEALAIEDDSKPFAEIDDAISPPENVEKKEDMNRDISVTSIDLSRSSNSDSKYSMPSRMVVAPTEDEIWGDFVDDVEEDLPTSQDAPVTANADDEVVPVLTQIAVETTKPAVATIITPERKKPALITSAPSPSEVKPEVVKPEPKPEPSPSEQPELEKKEVAESDETHAEESEFSEAAPIESSGPLIQITKFSRTEVIASLAFLLILIVGSFFVLRSYRSNLTVEKNLYAKPDYPVKGQIAEVKNSLTYWRAPIKDGPNPDPIKLDVKLLPVIEITLGSESTQGALRVMFHNEKGDIVGDTVTQNFSQGKFTGSSSESRAFSSTAGFVDFGEQEAYRAGQGKPWTIKVYEGPSDNASSDQFRLLFTTPIATERR